MIIKYKYYKAQGEFTNSLMEKMRELRDAYLEAIHVIRTSTIDGLKMGRVIWSGSKATHIGFFIPESKDWLIADGKFKNYHIYKPNKRYKSGKQLAELLSKADEPNYSSQLVKSLGASHSVLTTINGQPCMFLSVAGFIGNVVYIRVPIADDEPYNNLPFDESELHAEVVEITAEEFQEYLDKTKDSEAD